MYRLASSILAQKGSALPWLVDDRAAVRPLAKYVASSSDRACYGTLARATAPYQAFGDSAPCLSRAIPSRRGPNLSSEKAHWVDTIITQPKPHRVSIRQDEERRQPDGASPALNLPERPIHTHDPQPGFGGRGYEYVCVWSALSRAWINRVWLPILILVSRECRWLDGWMVITYSRRASTGMVASSARGQLNRENVFPPIPARA